MSSLMLQVAGESRIGYLLAVYTGLRLGELKVLSWRHINLNAKTPSLLLEGQFTKNKADAYIPLHREVVTELRAIKPADANASDLVLIGKMLPSMWKVKSDLKKAGIEFEKDGRRVDFHSLRHTLATNVARQNISPRVAMEILRHSHIRLTMQHYTDRSRLPVADAINTLPAFGSEEREGDDTQIRTQNPDTSGTEQSRRGTPAPEGEPTKVIQPERFWPDATLHDIVGRDSGTGCLARTRT